MVIGNPYRFSIITKVIEEWGDITFRNGVLLLCVNGNLFPKEVVTATLSREIQLLQNALGNLVVNSELFNTEKEKAFAEFYKLRHPNNDACEDNRYLISPDSLADLHCYIFAVSDGTQARILAAELEYIRSESTHNLINAEISEAFITKDELDLILSELGSVINYVVV